MGKDAHRQDVVKGAAAAMARVGFEKLPGEGIFITRLGDDVLGWASHMADRADDGAIEISPKVGVRHEAIHRIVDRLRNSKPDQAPTISEVLGHLMPQQSANVVWRFDLDTPLDAQADNMAEAIIEYGRPYMLAHTSLDALIEALHRSVPWEYSQMRIPVALMLAGRSDEAEDFIARELDKLGDRRDAAAQAFREFAQRFSDEFAGRPSN